MGSRQGQALNYMDNKIGSNQFGHIIDTLRYLAHVVFVTVIVLLPFPILPLRAGLKDTGLNPDLGLRTQTCQ